MTILQYARSITRTAGRSSPFPMIIATTAAVVAFLLCAWELHLLIFYRMSNGALNGVHLLTFAAIVSGLGAFFALREHGVRGGSMHLAAAMVNVFIALAALLSLAVVGCRLSGLGP